jgi:hypothetical protein
MMVKYIGAYCLARQDMTKISKKWRLKILFMHNLVNRFVSKFDVYCSISTEKILEGESKLKVKANQGQCLTKDW